MGYVYVWTLDERPVYVGKTIRHYLDRKVDHIRAASSGSEYPVHRAIRKYGLERMKLTPQLKCEDEDTLLEYEKYLIVALKTRIEEGGYNLTDGGDGTSGSVRSVESKEKNRQAHLGRKHSEESKQINRELNSGSNNGNSIFTDEEVIAIRKAYDNGVTQKTLAKKYNVSRFAIYGVVNRRTYKNVGGS